MMRIKSSAFLLEQLLNVLQLLVHVLREVFAVRLHVGKDGISVFDSSRP